MKYLMKNVKQFMFQKSQCCFRKQKCNFDITDKYKFLIRENVYLKTLDKEHMVKM